MKTTKLIQMLATSALLISGLSATAGEEDNRFFNDGQGFNGKSANGCKGLPTYAQLKAALSSAVAADTTGFNLNMWATIVDRDGIVCAVAFSGADRGAQWPGSRVISAQKANTANAFSLDKLALSTANLYSAVQGTSGATPLGGSLYGLQFSNPVDTAAAYGGNPAAFGTTADPMVGNRVGGINVFGGGLALYNNAKKVIGAVGLSGDTSCADHNQAWLVRKNLGLDNLAGIGGVSGDAARPDNIVYDSINGNSNNITDGWEQPTCANTGNPTSLPAVK
jgi:uncharacterized protein GlcG (DUF336 family)